MEMRDGDWGGGKQPAAPLLPALPLINISFDSSGAIEIEYRLFGHFHWLNKRKRSNT